MKKRLIIIIAVVLFVALAVLIYNFLRREKETLIRTAGIIEGTEVNLSPRVPGRISYLCCRESEKIIEGSAAVGAAIIDAGRIIALGSSGELKGQIPGNDIISLTLE